MGRYSTDALTAVMVIYPLQLVIVAMAVGTDVGVNTCMARKYAQNEPKKPMAPPGQIWCWRLLTRRIFALISLLIEDLGCCIKTDLAKAQTASQERFFNLRNVRLL